MSPMASESKPQSFATPWQTVQKVNGNAEKASSNGPSQKEGKELKAKLATSASLYDLDYYYDYPTDGYSKAGKMANKARLSLQKRRRNKNGGGGAKKYYARSGDVFQDRFDDGAPYGDFESDLNDKKHVAAGADSPDYGDYAYPTGFGQGVGGAGGIGIRRLPQQQQIRRSGGKLAKIKPFISGYGHFDGGHGYNVAHGISGHGGSGHGGGGGYGKKGGQNVIIVKKKKNADKGDKFNELFGDMGLDFEWFALALAGVGAIAGFQLFQAITMANAGRKKRKRSAEIDEEDEDSWESWMNRVSHHFWAGRVPRATMLRHLSIVPWSDIRPYMTTWGLGDFTPPRPFLPSPQQKA